MNRRPWFGITGRSEATRPYVDTSWNTARGRKSSGGTDGEGSRWSLKKKATANLAGNFAWVCVCSREVVFGFGIESARFPLLGRQYMCVGLVASFACCHKPAVVAWDSSLLFSLLVLGLAVANALGSWLLVLLGIHWYWLDLADIMADILTSTGTNGSMIVEFSLSFWERLQSLDQPVPRSAKCPRKRTVRCCRCVS